MTLGEQHQPTASSRMGLGFGSRRQRLFGSWAVYGRDSADLATAVELLLNHKDLILQDSDAVAAALSIFSARPALRFADCLMVELARKAGHLPLGTFDRDLAKVEGTQKLAS